MKNLIDYIRESLSDISDEYVDYISSKENHHVFMVIKPGFLDLYDDIIKIMEKKSWKADRVETKTLSMSEAKEMYKIHKNESFYEDLCKYMSSDKSTGIIFEKKDPSLKDPFKEMDKIKDQIRKKWGKSDMENVIHSSDSLKNMIMESEIYFND